MRFFSEKKSKYSFLKNSKGFTLVEILIVVSIVIVLSVIVLTNYEFGGYQFALQRSAYKLSQDLRRAQEMAMSSKTFGSSVPAGGYGIYLEHQTDIFILFADINNNGHYETNELVETLELEESTQISQICLIEESGDPSCNCGSDLDIVFVPPSPTIKFDNALATICSARITLFSSKTGQYMYVCLRPTGLIEIQDTECSP